MFLFDLRISLNKIYMVFFKKKTYGLNKFIGCFYSLIKFGYLLLSLHLALCNNKNLKY
jgi:hypothetical protein